jgi:prepilin-type N-terminal cleavage/methylation domain-containing protein
LNKNLSKNHFCNKGVTLLEIIVVFIILGILVVIAIPNLFTWINQSRSASAVQTLSSYSYQIDPCIAQNSESVSSIYQCVLPLFNNPTISEYFTLGSIFYPNPAQYNGTPYYSILAYSTLPYDPGGMPASCDSLTYPALAQSGVEYCHHANGNITVSGWGIYSGIS